MIPFAALLALTTASTPRPLSLVVQALTRPNGVVIEHTLIVEAPEYQVALAELREGLEKKTYGQRDVPAFLELLRTQTEGAQRAVADVLIPLAPEPLLIQLLQTWCEGGLRQGQSGYALGMVERLKDTRDRKAIPALVAYLKARRGVDGDAYDFGTSKAFVILHDTFHDPPEAIALLWTAIPSPNSSLWSTTDDLLSHYRGPRWREMVKDALTSTDPRARSIATRIAFESRDAFFRSALIPIARQALEDPKAVWLTTSDAQKLLADGARQDPAARDALVQVALSEGPESYSTQELVQRLGDEKWLTLRPEEWKKILAQMRKVGGSSQPFDFASHFDVTPILDDLLSFLDEPSNAFMAAGLLGEQRSDAIREKVLNELAHHPAEARARLLNGWSSFYRGQTWGRRALPFLKDPVPEVQQAALALLAFSSDPEVKRRIREVPTQQLLEWLSPYRAVSEGAKLTWRGPDAFRIGTPVETQIEIANDGVVPFTMPFDVPGQIARWELVIGKKALGPLPIQVMGNVKALGEHEKGFLKIDLHDAVAVLGPGRHTVTLRYFSRSAQRHWPQEPDFTIATAMRTVEVLAAQSPLPQAETWRAAVNSADKNEREKGWKQVVANPVAKGPTPDRYAPFETAARDGALPKGARLEIEIYDQEIHRQRYELSDAKGRYHWDEEDIRGDYDLRMSPEEWRSFFRALVASRVFEHAPLKTLGGPYDNRVTLRVRSGELDPGASVVLWWDEAVSHPALAPWSALLLKWKTRAEARP